MIGVVADDLTGAAEIGAVGLRYGLRAEIVVPTGSEFHLQAVDGKPAEAGTPNLADLICVDTDSRSCVPEEAGRRVGSAVKALRESGAEWIYKKVDSVLRGPVVAELKAAMQELHLNQALLAPANPALGRTIKDGKYFIGDKPIHETEFARDPEYPRTTSGVIGLLARAEALPIRVGSVGEPLPESGILVGEAAATEDLQHWARTVRNKKVFAAGGSGFFEALLVETGHAVPASSARPDFSSGVRELFVCGTASQSAGRFVEEARAKGTPVISLPAELEHGVEFTSDAAEATARRTLEALRSHSRVILNVGLPPVRDRSVAKSLAIHLVSVAGRVLGQVAVDRVYAEGGATAVTLARCMGWQRLSVLRELAPGVAMLAVNGDRSRLLIIKPGSYAWPA